MENYSEVFSNKTSKVIIGSTTTVLNLISCMLCFGIVWFEKFGYEHKRTLVNKLTSNFFTMAAVGLTLVHISESSIYFTGKNHLYNKLSKIEIAKPSVVLWEM